MIPNVEQVLSSSVALAAIVGSGDSRKIFRTAPKDATLAPYVVWSITSAVPENNLSDLPETDNSRISIDCYSKSQAQSRQMCEAAQAAIEAVTHVIFGPVEMKEDATKLWRWTFDSSWWVSR